MNITEVFYAVAIVYMVVTTVFLIAIAVFAVRLVMALQMMKVEFIEKLKVFQIAKYSLQLSVLKNIMKILGWGGERR